VRLATLPDLNGSWSGYLISSFDPEGAQKQATLSVTQTWRRIGVTLETEESESHSLGASIVAECFRTVTLSYEYLNEPKALAKTTMHTHRGTARVTSRRT